MEERALPPAIVLISDGMPTDDYQRRSGRCLDEPWGARAVRIAVGIGRDADLDVLSGSWAAATRSTANNPEQLVRSIRWASTAATRAASELQEAPSLHGPITWRSQQSSEGEQVW